MAGQTPRFNFNFFGGDTPGDLDDDADKYTGEDRLTLDRLLAAFEGHNHRLNAAVVEPTAEPGLLNDADGGGLEGGVTWYYVISFVNAAGLETICGPEVSVEMPDLLATPEIPQGEPVLGGSLIPGQYYFALSGLRGAQESALSDPSAITVLEDNAYTVQLTLPDLGDATSFQIWRMKDSDPGWTRVGTTSTSTFNDDGSVPAGAYGDPDNDPPLSTDGADTNAVTITLTGADADAVTAGAVASWRIYRTDTSGVYSSQSLVHEVVERTDELDPTTALVTSWIDDGDAQLTGSPKIFTQDLQIPPYTFESADTLPTAIGYPDNYPIITTAGLLYVARAGAWVPISGAAATGPTGPTGPIGATGPVGATGASGPPGDSSGGGGVGLLALYLDAPKTIVAAAPNDLTPVFDPIGLANGTAWEYEATIAYSCDDPSAEFYFAPSPFVAGLTYLSLNGEFYYTHDTSWPAKRFPLLAGILGTGTQDGGTAVTLGAANTMYQATIRWRVINASPDLLLPTVTCQILTPGATVTIGAGSVFTALSISPFAVSGATVG